MQATLAFLLALFSSQAAPAPTPTTDGPQCTYVYPRGLEVPKDTIIKGRKGKKTVIIPLKICNGDVQASWRDCTQRYTI